MKKIQILPNLFTTGNLCCGFLSILFVFRGEILTACGLILIANLFDILDGKIARLTKSTTSFGVQFDSLSDLVSFGIAPATLVYAYLFQHAYHRLALIIFCLYVACGALRLARFNVQVKSSTEKKYFTGLPIPAAGSLIASFILVVSSYQLVIPKVPLMIAIIVLSYLMISTIAYHIFV
ncbi:CDP-diacylglycerol--serine O-phosphatidyltransferase, partial [bacterium]|nr:CDP-diacylglycerol--serine O-phosphatidyltransferase [bacterium]